MLGHQRETVSEGSVAPNTAESSPQGEEQPQQPLQPLQEGSGAAGGEAPAAVLPEEGGAEPRDGGDEGGDQPAVLEGEDEDELAETDPKVLEAPSSAVPSFQGFLKKRGDKGVVGRRTMLKRHFRLFDSEAIVRYYKSEKDTKALGAIDLKGAMLAEATDKKGGFAITMKTKARVFHLQANNVEARDMWLSRVSAHMIAYADDGEAAGTGDDDNAAAAAGGAAPTVAGGEWAKTLPGSEERDRFRAEAAQAADAPTYRGQASQEKQYASTLAEASELPVSVSVRYRDPALATVAPHPLDGEVDSCALTIFSGSGSATVSEIRKVTLDADCTCTIEDLPRDCVSESFSVRSVTEPSSVASSIQYRVDPRTPEELLNKVHGQGAKVSVPRHGPAGYGNGGDGASTLELSGTVYHANDEDDRFMLGPQKGQQGKFHFLSTSDVVTFEPDSPIFFQDARLKVGFDAGTTSGGSAHELRLVYNVKPENFTWKAAYNFVLSHDESTGDFCGSFVVKNDSGRSWPKETSLVFVASPNTGEDGEPVTTEGETEDEKAAAAAAKAGSNAGGGFGALAKGLSAAIGGDKKKEVSKPRERSYVPCFHSSHAVPDDRETQLVFADANIRVASLDLISFRTPKFVSRPQKAATYGLGAESRDASAKTVLEFANAPPRERAASPNSLGNSALPAGSVFVTRKRADGHGVDVLAKSVPLPHTDTNSTVVLELEDCEGISATREQTGFNYDTARNFIIESFEIKVTNARDEPIAVTVQESMYRWKHWEITSSSLKWNPHPNPNSGRVIRWMIAIPAGQMETISYTVFYNRFPKGE